MKDPGRIAFEAYVASVGGSTHDGKPIPQWDALSDAVRRGWRCAAQAVNDLIASIETEPSVADLIEQLRGCAQSAKSRAGSLAVTKLDEFEMWLGKAAAGQ